MIMTKPTTVACQIGKHKLCNGWGDERDTLDDPKRPVKCECSCHEKKEKD
jgi:hypothetical protein